MCGRILALHQEVMLTGMLGCDSVAVAHPMLHSHVMGIGRHLAPPPAARARAWLWRPQPPMGAC